MTQGCSFRYINQIYTFFIDWFFSYSGLKVAYLRKTMAFKGKFISDFKTVHPTLPDLTKILHANSMGRNI